jgi:ATP-dependent RNA helicase DHX37/DHR1
MSSKRSEVLLEDGWDASTSKKRRSNISAEELIIAAPKKKRKNEDKAPKVKELINRAAVKAAKVEAKRLAILRQKRSDQEERDELLARLQQVQSAESSKYLKSSSKLGQRHETKKEALKRALNEERAGLERSAPEVDLYHERDQIVDLTAPRLISTQADDFIAENADLLKTKTKKKPKKSKTPAVANPTRTLKRKLFSVVESSDSDSEGHVRRRNLKKQHEKDSLSSISSSVSDIESSEEEKSANKMDITKAEPVPKEPSVPKPSSGFVIPSFTSAHRQSKTSMSTASSTQRAIERRKARLGVSDDSEEEPAPAPSSRAKGFVIPDFKKLNATATRTKKGEDESGETASSEDENDRIDVVDAEDEEMRRRHGSIPAREQKQFEFTTDENRPDISALAAPAPKSQRDAPQQKTRYFVNVKRNPEIDEKRRDLPILMEEHQIMDTIRANDFVIICGETGSGKTTQVPQFLYEAGFGDPKSPVPGMIGVTEPRRVAAISTSQRVAVELNQIPPGLETGDSNVETVSSSLGSKSTAKASKVAPTTKHVAYQVRYEVTSDKNTRIKFMTDGILLREIQSDFLLNRYSVIVIDEAHERTMNTDLLLGLLCRLVPLRNELSKNPGSHGVVSPLKVIIMSATLRVADFVDNARMFPTIKPPVIKIGARQFPVTIHFNRRTSLDNYVLDAYKKVIKIHTKLPAGGILVFLSGQAEIVKLVKMLRKRFDSNLDTDGNMDLEGALADFDSKFDIPDEDRRDESDESEESVSDPSPPQSSESEGNSGSKSSDEEDDNGSIDLDGALKPKLKKSKKSKKSDSSASEANADALVPESSKMDIDEQISHEQGESASAKKRKKAKKLKSEELDRLNEGMKVLVMPLYSMLAPKDQMRIFGALEPNTRLIVVATNIAETSLTIPGITYVVDSGRVKSKVFDKASGMTSYKVDWTSQASADQRAGRAGRTGPGHCYRLFSSAVYQRFPQFATPDILNIPIEGVVLQMKQMGIERLAKFPFPTPPDRISMKVAHQTLRNIGALEFGQTEELKDQVQDDWKITALGRALVNFPVAPRYAKMLIIAHQSDCLAWIIAIVAALAVGDPFLHETETVRTFNSDPRHTVWKAWTSNTSDLLVWLAAIGAFEYANDQEAFCQQHKLHFKTMQEIHLLREQLSGILSTLFKESQNVGEDLEMKTLEEDMDAEEMNLQRKIKEIEGKTKQSKFNKTNKPVFEAKLAKPSKEQNLKIRQIIASGLLDQVAKRYPKLDESGAPMKNRYVFRTATTSKECAIHPNSFLKFDPPEYVAYNELIETSETFICGVTAVSMGWMADLAPWLCQKMDVILETPKPRFDETKDTIIGAVQPYFFHSDWIVPKVMVPLQGVDLYKHFARCFLEGDICPELKPFLPFLNGNPESIFKVWTQAKIGALVQPLMDKRIKTREHLFSVWRNKDPQFWLSSLALWIDKSKHAALKAIWPPIPPTELQKSSKPQKQK